MWRVVTTLYLIQLGHFLLPQINWEFCFFLPTPHTPLPHTFSYPTHSPLIFGQLSIVSFHSLSPSFPPTLPPPPLSSSRVCRQTRTNRYDHITDGSVIPFVQYIALLLLLGNTLSGVESRPSHTVYSQVCVLHYEDNIVRFRGLWNIHVVFRSENAMLNTYYTLL